MLVDSSISAIPDFATRCPHPSTQSCLYAQRLHGHDSGSSIDGVRKVTCAMKKLPDIGCRKIESLVIHLKSGFQAEYASLRRINDRHEVISGGASYHRYCSVVSVLSGSPSSGTSNVKVSSVIIGNLSSQKTLTSGIASNSGSNRMETADPSTLRSVSVRDVSFNTCDTADVSILICGKSVKERPTNQNNLM